jgi:hypothetical protein
MVTKQTGFKHQLHNNISLIKPTLQYKQENNQVDKKLILKIVAPSKFNAKHFRKKKSKHGKRRDSNINHHHHHQSS